VDHLECIGNAMTKHGQFVTSGRAIIAYPIAMAIGAMTFFPLIIISLLTTGVTTKYGLVWTVPIFVRVELGVALAGVALYGPLVFPFYVAGMIVAETLGTRHWFYFATMGVILSIGLWAGGGFLGSRGGGNQISFGALIWGLIPFAAPIGVVSGLTCWLFLYLTFQREST
jgi:hypothetical protein